MPKKLDTSVFSEPVKAVDIEAGFHYSPRSENDHLLFNTLQRLEETQATFDAKLSRLDTTTMDHAERFRVRVQGHIAFNKDLKKWYAFNGMYMQEAPKWFLFKCIQLLSDGLNREGYLLGSQSQKGINTVCTSLDIKAESLKGKAKKDKIIFLQKALLEAFNAEKITPEQYQAVYQELEKIGSLNTRSGAFLHESRKIKDGRTPIQILEQVASTHGIEHVAADFDANTKKIAVLNGTLNLDNLHSPDKLLEPSTPLDLITMCMNAAYDPAAKAPKFEEQLRMVYIQPGVSDEEIVAMLKYARTMFGGALDRGRNKGTLFIHSGIPGSGKSVLLMTVGETYGSYTAYVDGSFFLDNPHRGKGDASPHMVKVVGKALVISTEIKNASASQLDEVLIKNWTGGDKLPYRPLYGEEKTFKPNGQLVLSTNELPRLSGDKAVGDRHRLAVHHCSKRVAKQADEDALKAELLAEAPGILNVLLQGLQERNSVPGRITPPAYIQEHTQDYLKSQDDIEAFFADASIQADSQDGRKGIQSQELYSLYVNYKGASSTDLLSMKVFSMKLQGRGYQKTTIKGCVYWKGIFAPEGTKKPSNNHVTPVASAHVPETQVYAPMALNIQELEALASDL